MILLEKSIDEVLIFSKNIFLDEFSIGKISFEALLNERKFFEKEVVFFDLLVRQEFLVFLFGLADYFENRLHKTVPCTLTWAKFLGVA